MKQQALSLCDTWAEKLAAIHPQDLSIAERAALAQHVQTCAACAAALADYRSMDAAILALPPVEALPALPLALRRAFGEEEIDGALLPSPLSRAPQFRTVLPRQWPHVQRPLRLVSAIAAVLVVAALISGFVLLFHTSHRLIGGTGAGQVIYVAAKDGTVYALRPGDGMVYWRYSIGQEVSGDLVASSDGVYASAGTHVYALRKGDGALRWISPAIPGGAFPPMLADGNAIYLSSPNSLYALSARDGHILWSREAQPCKNGCVAAFMAEVDGVLYAYLGEQQGGLYALRASDGQVIWHDLAYHFVSPQFAISEGKVFVPDERKGLLYELSASDGTLQHTFSLFQHNEPIGLVAADGVVYVNNFTTLYAIQVSDGEVLWQKQNNNIIVGLSAAHDGGLYFAATTVSVSSIQIVSSSGSPAPASTPTVSLVASTDAYALNIGNGSLRWLWHPPVTTGSASKILALNGNVYLTVGGNLYALSDKDGKQVWAVDLQTTELTAPVAG